MPAKRESIINPGGRILLSLLDGEKDKKELMRDAGITLVSTVEQSLSWLMSSHYVVYNEKTKKYAITEDGIKFLVRNVSHVLPQLKKLIEIAEATAQTTA